MSGSINNSPRCPYIGLIPYSEADADFFFGREDERGIIRANLFASRLTLLYGQSGVGKSSVLRAGVAYHLRQESKRNQDERGMPEFAVVYFNSWIDNPLTGLVNEVRKAVAQALNWDMSKLPAPRRELDETLEDLAELVRGHLLIILDQFEEYFQYQREEDIENTFAHQFPKAVNRPDLRANFLISMREDTLAKLDRFKGAIPELFENRYQIRHLSTKAARAAIEKPIETYNRLYAKSGKEIGLEPSLVDAVLEEVETGRDFWGETGKGAKGTVERLTPVGTFIETPYLQLVMTRLWNEEMGDDSQVLRLDTLTHLGGAQNIVRTHLDAVMNTLTKDEQEAAARAFYHLVTPSGTKIAHKVSDLMEFTELPQERLLPLLEKLSGQDTRILRPIAPPPNEPAIELRYEIFHDVLAKAILDWRSRYMKVKELAEAERRVEEQRQRAEIQLRTNKRLWRLSIALVVLVLLLGYGIYRLVSYMYGSVWEHVEYYNSFEKRRGTPVGIGKLTPDQVKRRTVSFKFIKKGHRGPVVKLIAVNSTGEPTPHHGLGTYFEPRPERISPLRECQYEFVTGPDGQVVYEKAYDKYGKLVWGFVYSPRGVNDPIARAHFVGPDGYPKPRTNSAAEFVEFEYSAEGYESILRYFDRKRNPQPGPDKAYGQGRKFDKRGQLIELTSLDRDGKTPMNDEYGNATIRYTYDQLGNIVERVALDAGGTMTTVKDGWSKVLQKYDEYGNSVEWAYFDTMGKPTPHKDGYHRSTAKYDERGNQTEWAYFDTMGKPTPHKDGYPRETAKYDERGNPVEWAFFDMVGRPMLLKDGYHRATGKYDERGNQTEWAYFDTMGRPILLRGGYHRATGKYDEWGNQTEWAYFDTMGKPTPYKDGYHRATAKYDEHGNRIELAFFDTTGKPTIDESDGSHKYIAKYDERGNRIERAYFDTMDKPTLRKDGYQRVTGKYDKRGNRIEWAYFDMVGKPTLSKDGYHRVTGKYDERGNRIEWAFFDTTGKPTIDESDGSHKYIAKYDERGNQVEWAYFDTMGKPMLIKDGYHRVTGKYDDGGNLIYEEIYGIDGRPVLGNRGFAIARMQYDSLGRKIEEAYLGIDGKPILGKNGYAGLTREYDDRGNQTRAAYFGTDRKPVLSEDGYAGWKTEYDDRGNPIYEEIYGIDGRPVLGNRGFAIAKMQYDPRGKKIEEAYFGKQGEQVTLNEVHIVRFKHDSRGNMTEKSFFNVRRKPVMVYDDGVRCARWVGKYDATGRLIKKQYYDEKDQLIDSVSY